MTITSEDFARARHDLKFFSEKMLGITPHPGQAELWKAIQARDDSLWRPKYLNIDVAAGNRAGKTLGISIPMLHSTLFKLGMVPPDTLDDASVRKWMLAPYEWYHFAIAQEIAELAFIEIQRIMQGVHEAQKAGCPITDQIGQFVRWDQKYRGEYLWMQIDEKFGGGNMHFRTTGEKAIGSLGKDMNGISYDEAGMDRNFIFVVNEVLNLRRLSTGGQMWIIGTATEGITDFADHWAEGDPAAPDRKPDSFSMRMSTRLNIGYGIDQEMFDRILAQVPPGLVPQNIDGYFIQSRSAFFDSYSVDTSFVDGLPEMEPAEYGHHYVQGVDPANKLDSAWSIVLDHNQMEHVCVGVRAVRQKGRATGPKISAMATDAHNAYTAGGASCITGVDSTGFGGAMFRDSLYIEPLVSVEFGGTRIKKLRILNNLRDWLEQGRLRFPRSGPWLELRRQLLGYRIEDKGLDTDAVMALAVAMWVIGPAPQKGSPLTVDFNYFYGDDPTAIDDDEDDVVTSRQKVTSSRDWQRFNRAMARLTPRDSDEWD